MDAALDVAAIVLLGVGFVTVFGSALLDDDDPLCWPLAALGLALALAGVWIL